AHLVRFFVALSIATVSRAAETAPARVIDQPDFIVLDNGIVSLRISRKNFEINSIRYTPSDADGPIELGNGADAAYFDFNGGPTTLPAEMESKRPRAGYQRLGNWVKSMQVMRDGPDFADVATVGGPTSLFTLCGGSACITA